MSLYHSYAAHEPDDRRIAMLATCNAIMLFAILICLAVFATQASAVATQAGSTLTDVQDLLPEVQQALATLKRICQSSLLHDQC